MIFYNTEVGLISTPVVLEPAALFLLEMNENNAKTPNTIAITITIIIHTSSSTPITGTVCLVLKKSIPPTNLSPNFLLEVSSSSKADIALSLFSGESVVVGVVGESVVGGSVVVGVVGGSVVVGVVGGS